jgi:hypothetical protein
MNRARLVAAAVIVGAVAAGAWWFVGRTSGTAGLSARAAQFAVRWRGSYQGTMTLPARLNWCPGTRRGILEALSGDSAVAIVLYERDSLTGGAHSVVSPDLAASIQPPGATMVLRWMRFGRDSGVTGFRSQGGTVRIHFANGVASGDVNVRGQVVQVAPRSDTLVVQGVFRDVPVVTTAAGCS